MRLLGIPDAHVSGERLNFAAGKRVSCLAYLAYHRGAWVSRSDLTLLFWGEGHEASARANLRQTLCVLRKTGLGAALEADDVRVRFTGDVDLTSFAAARNEGAFQRALEVYRGPFLEGWSVSRFPRVDAWIARTRSELSEARRDILVGRAAQLERVGRPWP